jgi:hypothetical protein
MPDRTIAITDAEARLAAQGKLGALVRVMKPQPVTDGIAWAVYWEKPNRDGRYGPSAWGINDPACDSVYLHSPFIPGQPLGLKETWADDDGRGIAECLYKADADSRGFLHVNRRICAPDWRSPVTMPARFIRHRPTVQEVRAVQICRMQPEDAIALGFSTKLREHDAVCHLREQVAEYYHIEPSTWVWFARLKWPS